MKNVLKLVLSLVLLIGLFWLYLFMKKLETPKVLPAQSSGMHYGANQTTEFFDQAYKYADSVKPTDKIAGITVNHHLLAPNLIAKEFSLVATDKPITVVLISPNHFFRGNGGAISSQFDWQTPYGVLKTNQDLVSKLQSAGVINVDETPFEQEHGINNIVGFIKRSLPNATFISLIVKDNLPDAKVDQLATELDKDLPGDALIVGSLDFSHYLPSNGAQFHDVQTLAAINNFDYDRIPKLDIDSHSGLRLLLKYFELRGDKRFVVTSHENSSTATGNYTFVETTSYIDGYFTSGVNLHDDHHTVLYTQGLTSAMNWKADASERLYEFNDQVTTEKPVELSSMDLGTRPLAVGLVYNPNLTDIYLFALDTTGNQITLPAELKPDTIHIQIKQ